MGCIFVCLWYRMRIALSRFVVSISPLVWP